MLSPRYVGGGQVAPGQGAGTRKDGIHYLEIMSHFSGSIEKNKKNETSKSKSKNQNPTNDNSNRI